MVGIVIVAHGNLAAEIIGTTAMIAGESPPAITALAVTGSESPEDIRQSLLAAIRAVDQNDGVIIFTDMFGGTPSNIALSLWREDKVEIISGVNLPMLVELIYSRADRNLTQLCGQIAEVGRGSIRLAGEFLNNGASHAGRT